MDTLVDVGQDRNVQQDVFRAMTPDDDEGPHVARSPRGLGVRPGVDVTPDTGPISDWVFSTAESELGPSLAVRPDPDAPGRHAFVEPVAPAPIETYEADLAATRHAWKRAFP